MHRGVYVSQSIQGMICFDLFLFFPQVGTWTWQKQTKTHVSFTLRKCVKVAGHWAARHSEITTWNRKTRFEKRLAQVEWDLDSSSIRCGFLSVSWLAEKIWKTCGYMMLYMMLYDVTCGSCAVCFFLHIFSINFLVSSVASWGWAAGPLVFPNASRSLMEVPFHDVPWWIDMNRCESMWVDVEWCERELCAV